MINFTQNIYLRKILILTIWFSFFASINLNPLEILSYNFINKMRLVLPLILCIFFFFISFKFKKKENDIVISSSFYFIFITYILFTFNQGLPIAPPFSVGIFKNSPLNIFWPLYMLLIFFLVSKYCSLNDKFMLIKFSLFIIFLLTIYFLYGTIIDMIGRKYYHFYGLIRSKIEFAGNENPPKPSGLARMCLVVYSYFVLNYLLNNKYKNYIFLLLIAFFGIFTILFQSRTVNFIYIIINLIFIIFYFKKYFFDKRLIIFCLILPLLFNGLYTSSIIGKYINISQDSNVLKIIYKSLVRDQKIWNEEVSKKDKIVRFSSGRFGDWEKALQRIKTKPIEGYGAQSDRFFLNGQSVHNSLLYAYISGGIFAALAIIIIYIYSALMVLKFYFFRKSIINSNHIFDICAIILVIISLRSILETSFAVFSIDYLLYILSILTLSKASYTKTIKL